MDSKGKQNTMRHAFASAALIHAFDFSNISEANPQTKLNDLQVKDLLHTSEDYESLKEEFVYHLVQSASQFLPYFKFLKRIVKHPESQDCEQLTTKTQVVLLDTLHKNGQKYADVVDILDSYEKIVENSCQNLQNVTVHIGGDQLTRERLSGAKCLRAGANDPKEKFDHLGLITFEMFHLHMNFLMVFFKFLYSDSSSNELGTMKFEINRIMRTNVDLDVRKAYDADTDFVLSFLDAHLIEMICHYLGLDNHLSVATKHVPNDLNNMSNEMKLQWTIVDSYVWQTELPKPDSDVVEDGQYIPLELRSSDGTTMKLSARLTVTTPSVEKEEDYVKNYAHMVVELGLLYKELLHLSKEPN